MKRLRNSESKGLDPSRAGQAGTIHPADRRQDRERTAGALRAGAVQAGQGLWHARKEADVLLEEVDGGNGR